MTQRILVFESDAQFAGEVSAGFADLGAEVEVVADGTTGLERASSHPPDLFLLCNELPGMSGFLVCKKIKKDSQLKRIPMIILSNDVNADDIFEKHRTLRARADDYARKPISVDELIERVRALMPLPGPGGQNVGDQTSKEVEVDEEIEAFTESAFDSLIVEEGGEAEAAPPASQPAAEAVDADDLLDDLEVEDVDFDSIEIEELTESDPPVAVSSAPPAAVSSAPPSAVSSAPPMAALGLADTGRVSSIPEGLAEELRTARTRVHQLEDELSEVQSKADAKVEAIQRELAELRASKTSGVSSREFLDLREALNSKDKEILDLQDQVSARDKQLLELRDQNLQQARDRAGADDKLIHLEREIAEAKETIAGLGADREAAAKRDEDFKGRLAREQERARNLEDELENDRLLRAQEGDALRAEREQALQTLAGQHAQELAAAQTAKAAALQAAEEQRDTALASLRAELALEAERVAEEAQQVQATALAARDEEHTATLARAQADAAVEKERAVSELTEEWSGKLQAAEAKREAELEQASQAHAAALVSKEQEVTELKDQAIAELQEEHSKQLAVLGRKLADTEEQLAEAEGNLSSTKDQLSQTQQEREQLSATKAQQEEQIAVLRANRADLEQQLQQSLAKIAADDEILTRVRKAMTIGLALLEDQKANVVGADQAADDELDS